MDPYNEERLRNEVIYVHSLYDEERLRNEVIYLHSLWHQGPPNPRPANPFVPSNPRPVQLGNSNTFENRKRKERKPIRRRGRKKRTQVDPHLNLGPESPMPTQDSAPVVSGWPPLEPRPAQATPPLSAEEKEKLQALQVQYKARQACREFLFDYDDSDDDDDVEDEEDNVDNDDGDVEAEEIAEFFSKLFGENNELRNYYEKCWESGEFRCLVCAVADNKNAGKRFHDCVGLVQHSMSISRTKNKRAHRAFGNAVCNVLGWDIRRLPTIVMKNEVKPAEAEGKTNHNAADEKDGSLPSDKLDDEASAEQLGEPAKQDVEVVHETNKGVSELLASTQDSVPVVSGWPPLEARPTQATPPLSEEEKEKLQALQVQYKARQACREFLFNYDDSDDANDVEDDEGNVDDGDDNDDEAEEIGGFFSKLFGENNDLRNYYEKCWDSGEFRCLVCAVADNKNAGKRFHDCVGLVQHSMSISRTKNIRAHRAFGNAVTDVLGWDIHRLPTIVMKREVKPAEAEGETNDNAADGKDGSLPSNKLDDELSMEQLGEPVKQDVEVVHETIKRVSELLPPTQDSAPLVSRWPPLEPHPTQATHPLSAKEKEILEVIQVQYKARQACQEFLFGSDDSNDGGGDDDEDDMDDDDEELVEMGDFFFKLFGENDELRKYYKKCWEGGEFCCLVCGVADNKNAGKRFHDCVGLVQHSMSISRTKKKRAHRAFGNAVCNVLGWDISRLPTIVIKNEVKPAEAEGNTNKNDVDVKDGSLSSDKLDYKVSLEQLGVPVRQGVEVVHETIKQGELGKSAVDPSEF